MPTSTSLRVGLTGGIASGKSTVGRIMASLGCFVADADQLVKELYQPGALGSAAVAQAFGDSFLDSHGTVDKEKLSKLVFSDHGARKTLEQLIHPLVAARFEELVRERESIEQSVGECIAVFEATLLVEGGGYRAFDRLITVEANSDLRLQRAIGRGLEESEAKARLLAQATQEHRVEVADYVIFNEGTLDELRTRTETVVEALFDELNHKSLGRSEAGLPK